MAGIAAYIILFPFLVYQKADKLCRKKNWRLQCSEWKAAGPASVAFKDLLVSAELSDTLFYAACGQAGFSLFRFLTGKLPVSSIELNSFRFFYGVPDSGSSSNSGHLDEQKTESSFSKQLNNLYKKAALLPELKLKDGNLVFKNPALNSYTIHLLEWNRKSVECRMDINQNFRFQINGKKKDRGFQLKAEMHSENNRLMPIGTDSLTAALIFDSLAASLVPAALSDKRCDFQINIKVNGCRLEHWRIAPQPVTVDDLSGRLNLLITDSSLVLDSASEVLINRIRVLAGFDFTNAPQPRITLQTFIPEIPSQLFFESLPDGLFNSFKGIQTEGKLSYRMRFSADLALPDSLKFESELKGHKFRIRKFGEVNPRLLNEPFVHRVFEKGRVVRSFEVGSSNPDYVSMDRISPFLIESVLISEDGTFYGHSGFNEESFRQSIVTNLKERRFARGGSTITMQLVRNLYLGRDKNIVRKVEEALWVWLIENFRMVSKDRLLEIYLNIIEWGPGIYGIGEASEYYFNKKPSELTLAESIFLAGIIPHPRQFKYAFDAEGNLKNYFRNFFSVVSSRLASKEKITEAEFSSLVPRIVLSGPARLLVIPSDTIPDFDQIEADEE